MRKIWITVALTISTCVLLPHRLVASPLNADTCARLETERKALVGLGVDKYYDKGVDWAKANLTVNTLNLAKRYLDLYEQLKFRCKEEVTLTGAGIGGEENEDSVDDDDAETTPSKTEDSDKKESSDKKTDKNPNPTAKPTGGEKKASPATTGSINASMGGGMTVMKKSATPPPPAR
jgi:hypothetical protein